MSEESYDRKKTFILKGDLDQRVRDLAAKLKMEPGAVLNKAMDGFVQAVEASDVGYEMAFLTACRLILKKPTLTSKLVFSLLSIGAPKLTELRDEAIAWRNKYLIELLEQNDAPLTHKLMETYQKQAEEMNRMRVAREREMEKAKKTTGQ